jgi:phage tail sheath gpL-like
MAVLLIQIDTGAAGPSAAQLANIASGFGRASAGDSFCIDSYLSNLVRQLAAGVLSGRVSMVCDAGAGVQATGTVTCAFGSAVANDTITIAGEVFTVIANTATPVLGSNQFRAGATNPELAANLAAAINASPIAGGIVVATAAAAVVTLTARIRGLYGNGVTQATSKPAAFTLSAATLTGGTASTGNAAATSAQCG